MIVVRRAVMTMKITRDGLTAQELRREAARCSDAAAARRMLALALVLDGRPREEAAGQCGMQRQTLRDWVQRYNAEGLPGLSDRPHAGGPQAKLSVEQQEQVAEWVRAGPELETDGVVRWRRVDLREKIVAEFRVRLHERSVGKLLRRLNFRRISVRPRHPQADASAQETHKKTLPAWSPTPSRSRCAASQSSSGGRTRHASASRAR